MFNFLKFILISSPLLLANILAHIEPANAEIIRTKSFEIKVNLQCREQNISCETYTGTTYVGKSLKTGKSISLTGTALYSKSGKFGGYKFRNGAYTYEVIWNAPYTYVWKDNYTLLIYKGEQIILEEKGIRISD